MDVIAAGALASAAVLWLWQEVYVKTIAATTATKKVVYVNRPPPQNPKMYEMQRMQRAPLTGRQQPLTDHSHPAMENMNGRRRCDKMMNLISQRESPALAAMIAQHAARNEPYTLYDNSLYRLGPKQNEYHKPLVPFRRNRVVRRYEEAVIGKAMPIK